MSDLVENSALFEPETAKRLHDQLAVSRAADLAVSGEFAAAESLLKGLVQRPQPSVEAIDLLGRICAQQGRVMEATELWRRALTIDSANPAYAAALLRVQRMQRHPIWLTVLWPTVSAVVAVALCILVVQRQSIRQRLEWTALEARIDRAATTMAKSGDVSRLEKSLDDLRTLDLGIQREVQQVRRQSHAIELSSRVTAQTTKLISVSCAALGTVLPRGNSAETAVLGTTIASPPLRLDFALAGVVGSAEGRHWLIRFEKGLFDGPHHLKSDSVDLLESVAKRLVQSQERITVVIGSDRFGDLYRERTRTVLQFLESLGLFPAGALRIEIEAIGETGRWLPREEEAIWLRVYRVSEGRGLAR